MGVDYDRLDKSKEVYVQALNYEASAMQMVRSFDPLAIEPVAHLCRVGYEREIWNYFRLVISSEMQFSRSTANYREKRWMLLDKVSGVFLGLWGTGGAPIPWKPFDEFVGAKLGGFHSENPTAPYVVYITRCLPAFEFGSLTGGKLLALLASSRECIRMLEVTYSFRFAAMMVKTLHGKSSQYNRLNQRGLEFVGAFDGRGFYMQELRKKGYRFLRGEVAKMGAMKGWSFAEQVDYWKERWLSIRLNEGGGPIEMDRAAYTLSLKMDRLFERSK